MQGSILDIKDVVLLLIYAPALLFLIDFFGKRLKDEVLRKYFFSAAAVRMLAAVLVGLLYQYYYENGDTMVYFRESKVLNDVLLSDPEAGIRLLFSSTGDYGVLSKFGSVVFYSDASTYTVIRITAVFNLFTFETYSVTALFFALFSFSGAVAMYKVFARFYPSLKRTVAIAVLFVPSVVFWGSGLMKDSLTFGALGWMLYALDNIFFERKKILISGAVLLASTYLVYITKIYILLAFAPSYFIFLAMARLKALPSKALKIILAPFIVVGGLAAAYYVTTKITEKNQKYAIGKLAGTAKITAEYINEVSEKSGGSAYSLGDFDATPEGLLKKFFPALGVTFYRPFLWEVKNPVMLLAALESLAVLFLTVTMVIKRGFFGFFRIVRKSPFMIFCLLFSAIFAFAVGISTYNFGTLVRYKIPCMPFIAAVLLIMNQRGLDKKTF